LDASEGTSNFDFGIAMGAGATLDITQRIALGVEARYTHGLSTVDDAGEVEIQNRAVFFTVGIGARFGMPESSLKQ
jgi:opacity protein-like surface antigen